jgi:PncC family amidohydrolase
MARDLLALSRRVGAALMARNLSVCAAESCTGGLILSTMTDCAGSSAYVEGGVVSYSNEAKMRILGVREDTLIAHGAVSEAVAAEMAQGALALYGADYALSATGIAGPGGGSAEKPVGLTYLGLAGPEGLMHVARQLWDGDRIANKVASVEAAFEMLLTALDA